MTLRRGVGGGGVGRGGAPAAGADLCGARGGRWSTAGVLQRQLTLDTPTQVFGRAAFAGAALLGYVAIVERGQILRGFKSVGGAGIAVALCVAIASGCFIGALNHASVARVLFILAVAPVLAALLAWATLGEPISRRTRWRWCLRCAASR